MGVDTVGIVRKEVGKEDILQAIKILFDKNASSDIKDRKNETIQNDFMGSINFKHNEEDRRLFVCKTIDPAEGTEFHNVAHTSFILRNWGSSVSIMQMLVAYFGGYVDDNDCDDVGYYELCGNEIERKPVIEVTMEEVFKKFGRVVRIVNR